MTPQNERTESISIGKLHKKVYDQEWRKKNRAHYNQYFRDRYHNRKPIKLEEVRQAEKEYEQIKHEVKIANMRLSDLLEEA